MREIFFENRLTAFFVGDELLNSITDAMINWKDERSATAFISACLPEGKADFDKIRTGATLDVVLFGCDGVRKLRANGTVIYSIVDIFDVEKYMDSIIAGCPSESARLMINATLCGALRFGGAL